MFDEKPSLVGPRRPTSLLLVVAATLVVMIWTTGRRAQADAPAGRYTLPGDGTVKDNRTGLVWKRNEEAGLFSWIGAKAQCTSPWRLPRIQELQTIIDYTKPTGPSIDATFFQGSSAASAPTSGFVWSSSPVTISPGQAWLVEFDGGIVNRNSTTLSGAVRCVR